MWRLGCSLMRVTYPLLPLTHTHTSTLCLMTRNYLRDPSLTLCYLYYSMHPLPPVTLLVTTPSNFFFGCFQVNNTLKEVDVRRNQNIDRDGATFLCSAVMVRLALHCLWVCYGMFCRSGRLSYHPVLVVCRRARPSKRSAASPCTR